MGQSQQTYGQTEKGIAVRKAYRRSQKGRATRRAYEKTPKCISRVKAYRETMQGRLQCSIIARLRLAIRRGQKAGSIVTELGCSIQEVKAYIESQFMAGMTWDNWARDGWHIDHIKPLSSFDLTDRNQFLQACHFTNLQPLWAAENLIKGSSLEWEAL